MKKLDDISTQEIQKTRFVKQYCEVGGDHYNSWYRLSKQQADITVHKIGNHESDVIKHRLEKLHQCF